MSDELFPPDQIAVDSPRIKWMKQHGIKCVQIGDDEDGNPQWHAHHTGVWNKGVTRMSRDSAIESLAHKLGIKDWRQTL